MFKAQKLVNRLLFQRNILIPSASRWWKCVPTSRMIFLGAVFHNLFHAAPTGLRKLLRIHWDLGVGYDAKPLTDRSALYYL